jgi:hypothetical protein
MPLRSAAHWSGSSVIKKHESYEEDPRELAKIMRYIGLQENCSAAVEPETVFDSDVENVCR